MYRSSMPPVPNQGQRDGCCADNGHRDGNGQSNDNHSMICTIRPIKPKQAKLLMQLWEGLSEKLVQNSPRTKLSQTQRHGIKRQARGKLVCDFL